METLRDLILDALQGIGYGVIEAITLWNTEYKPQIKALPAGKHTISIRQYEITFTKGAGHETR